MKAIETANLTKRYGEKVAVEGLNLSVEQGELFALLGVNGAGKTTTIKMLSGLSAQTFGDVTVLGFHLPKQREQLSRFIAVSPQETAVAPNLTVRENLELIAGIYGASRKTAAELAQRKIVEFRMEDITKCRAKTLSGGWQRRLSIAMALISEPKILFLDEPTLGLDVLARRELWQLIEQLKGNITIILTTHYMEEAEQLSDRVGIMSDGRLRLCGTPDELKRTAGTQNFEEAFVRLAGGELQ